MLQRKTFIALIIHNTCNKLVRNNTITDINHLIFLLYKISFKLFYVKIFSYYFCTLILICLYYTNLFMLITYYIFIRLFCCYRSQKINSDMNIIFLKVRFHAEFYISFITILVLILLFFVHGAYYIITMLLVYYHLHLLILCYIVQSMSYFTGVHSYLPFKLSSLRWVSAVTFYVFNNGYYFEKS